jgi:hypothetical protein
MSYTTKVYFQEGAGAVVIDDEGVLGVLAGGQVQFGGGASDPVLSVDDETTVTLVLLSNLPTDDPHVKDALYVSNGTLKISV